MNQPSTIDELHMLQHPDRWPCWPYLPVKRRTEELCNNDLGVVIADGEQLTVYYTYLFDVPKEGFERVPRTEYTSHEAMLADGWIVD